MSERQGKTINAIIVIAVLVCGIATVWAYTTISTIQQERTLGTLAVKSKASFVTVMPEDGGGGYYTIGNGTFSIKITEGLYAIKFFNSSGILFHETQVLIVANETTTVELS